MCVWFLVVLVVFARDCFDVCLQTDTTEDLFAFTADQLLAIVDFIALEASQSRGLTPTNSGSMTVHSASEDGVKEEEEEEEVGGRLKLLLGCVCDKDDRLRSIVSHIHSKLELSSGSVESNQIFQYLSVKKTFFFQKIYVTHVLPLVWLMY
jgi:hypothetical protein